MASTILSASDHQLLKALWADAPERYTLPNGLTLIVRPEAESPVTSVQVWVKTGSIHEGEQLGAGLSHFLEHMLFKGTARRAGRDISATVQAHGGYINAYTSFDRTVYYIDVPTEHTDVAIDVLADMVFHSTLPAEEIEKEKQVILREIDMGQDDPDQRLGQALFETAYREHPYRQPVIGHRDVFEAVDRDALLAYYQSRYVPNNAVVVIAGVSDVAGTRALVEAAFGSLPRRRLAPVYLPPEPTMLSPRERHLHEDVEVVRAGLGWPIPGLEHEDAPVLDVLAMLLGHGDSSRLWQAIREKARLVHSIDAMSWNPGTAGLFYISFSCDAGRREAATAAIAAELGRVVAGGFTVAEVRKAIRQLVVNEINGRKTMAGQAGRLGMSEVVVGDLNYSRHYFERVRLVTPARLRAVLQRYLQPGQQITVSQNPASDGIVPAVKAAEVKRRETASGISELRTKGGARLVMQPNSRLPNLHIRLLAMGGPATDPAGRRGATALLATLLTRDTARRSATEVAQAIEAVGGSFYPFTGNNSFGLAVEVLPTEMDLALEVLGDAVCRPRFKADSFAIERDAQIADLAQDDDDVVTFGRKRMRRLFFGEHPFATDAAGLAEDLERLTVAQVKALHKRLLVAPNVVLSVAGDFDPVKLGPKLRRWLEQLPAAGGKDTVNFVAPSLTQPASPGDFVETQPRQQAVVFQAFPAPGLGEPDFYVGELADELFSGMSSRLFERVREDQGLAYFVRSSRVAGLRSGLFYFYAGTAPGKEDAVLTEIDREIARIAAGRATKEEIKRCQTRLLAARRMGRQTNSARAMHAGLNAIYGQPLDNDAEYAAAISAVDKRALATFAKTYLTKARRTQLVVRP